ncbi:hypothetical protein TIFTF001_020908 [Ficus carica]|uniref:Glutaredoxin-like protein n=1 Tax=Ficus carica TaxID=3494 RepID=A0AA88AGK7_FICCA|nr:hypothetical protein TIFTF001_020908 [Ficus carica]
MAMAAANVTAMGIRPTSGVILTSFKARRVLTPLALSSSSSSSSSSKPPRKLILYSKPECCLCEGLKEKLEAAFLLSGPDSLHDVHLEIRDITTCPCWEKEFQYEIPVLAKVLSDGTEDFSEVGNMTQPRPNSVSACLAAVEDRGS